MTLSSNANMNDVITEINKLQRQVNALQSAKRAGRNVTGGRAVPSSHTNTIQGDVVGDFLYDGNHCYELSIVDAAGTVNWIKYTANMSF